MTDRQKTLWTCAALLLAVGVLYAHVFSCEFVEFDDKSHITENPAVRAGLDPAAIHWVFTHFIASQWIPLSWLSHMVDITVFGLHAGWHHLVNEAFHALNACLVFLVLFSLTGRRWPSAVVAALFAVHPINVESVAWITERKNVLSTTFWLLAMGIYVRHARHPRGRWMWIVALCMALGLMAKPMLVTLPCALLLLDVWPLRRHLTTSWPALVLEKTPLWLLSLASCATTLMAAAHDTALTNAKTFSIASRLTNMVTGYEGYLQHLVWPHDLAVLYPLRESYSLAAILTAVLLLLGITALCLRLRRTQPQMLVGWLWFLGILVPVSGISQVGAQAYADRFCYIPELGIFWAVVWFLSSPQPSLPSWPRWRPWVTGLVLAALSLGTLRQVRFWTDTVTLFEETLRVTPKNGISCALAGMGWARRHDYPRAIVRYREALTFLPRENELRVVLATALVQTGELPEAIHHLKVAVNLRPDDKAARYNLITLLARTGQPEEAAKYLPKTDAAPAKL